MTDQTVTLRITANADGTIRAVRQLSGELDRMGTEGAAGGAAAARGLKQTESGARQARSAVGSLVDSLKDLAAPVTGAAGAVMAARMADEYTNLSSKIRLVTSSEQELKSVREAVFQVAQQTRQDLGATANLYTRLARATADMGLSQQKLLGITTTINQAFVISGSTAQEASAAITQLSQGLASGVLRGEEFNSVAEQAPIIMDLLAKQLGVTRGELRKMAEEGQLTADVLIDALGNGAASVAKQFDGMALTIGASFTLLRNALTKFVGQSSEASGAAATIAAAIAGLSENLNTVANILGVVVVGALARVAASAVMATGAMAGTAIAAQQVAVGMGLAATASGAAATAMGVLAAAGRGLMALLGGPVGVAIAAATLGIVGLRAVTQTHAELLQEVSARQAEQKRRIEESTAAWHAHRDALRQANPAIIQAELERNNALLLQTRGRMEGVVEGSTDYAFKLRLLAERQRELVAELEKANPAIAAQANAWTQVSDRVGGVLKAGQERLGELREEVARTVTGGDSAVQSFQRQLLAAAGGIDGLRRLSQEQKDAIIAVSQALSDADGQLRTHAARQRAAAQAVRDHAEEQAELRRTADAGRAALEDLNDVLDRQARNMGGPAVEAAQDYRDELFGLLKMEIALNAAGLLSAQTVAMLAQARRQAAEGYAQQLAEIADDEAQATAQRVDQQWTVVDAASAAAAEYERAWVQGADNVAFALGDFVSGSIRSFRELGAALRQIAQRMISDIVAIFLRQRIIIPIQMAMAGGGGGMAGMAGQMMGGAGGGIGSMLGRLSPGAIFGNAAFSAGTSLFGLGGSIGAFGGGMATAGANMIGSGFFGSMGANVAGGFGAMGSGSIAAGLGQLLPVIGQIAAIATLVNSLAGGRLFGTSFRPDSAARQIDISGSGAGGFESATAVRHRSLFRGRQWRETRSDLPSDVQQQISDLFEAVQMGMQAAATATGARLPQMIAGSFRQEFDRSGTLLREFSTIAGRVFDESQEAFGQRLLAENLLAVLSEVLPAAEVARLADLWRGNAAELLSGAQLLTAVATELRAASPLFAAGAGVTERIVALAVSLQESGESLTDTFLRIVSATRAYGAAVASIEQDRLLEGLSGFQRGLIEIRMQERARLQQLQQLARAAGNLAAREEDLAAVRQASVEAQQRLAESLRLELLDLAAQLYGTPLSVIEGQLAQLTEVQRVADDAARSVREFLDSLRQSDELSPLTDAQRRSQAIEAMQRAAATGDAESFRRQANALLAISRRLFASGSDYNADFSLVQQLGGRFEGGGNTAQIAALEAERNALLERDRRAQRLATAQTLAQGIADYARASGQSFEAIAGGLGFNLQQLASDLGIGAYGLDAYLQSLQRDTDVLISALEALPDRIARAMFDLLLGEGREPTTPGTGPGIGPGTGPGTGPGIGIGIGPWEQYQPVVPRLPREIEIESRERATQDLLRATNALLTDIKRASESTANGVQTTSRIQQRAMDRVVAGKPAPTVYTGAIR